jgi:hypothetical protein
LFVTTRILNFLKGLPITGSKTLGELLSQPSWEPRTQNGFTILRQFADTGILHFWTPMGLIQNKHFKSAVCARVLAKTGAVACQNGGSVEVRDFGLALLCGGKVQSITDLPPSNDDRLATSRERSSEGVPMIR